MADIVTRLSDAEFTARKTVLKSAMERTRTQEYVNRIDSLSREKQGLSDENLVLGRTKKDLLRDNTELAIALVCALLALATVAGLLSWFDLHHG